jgi:hypothetical protein
MAPVNSSMRSLPIASSCYGRAVLRNSVVGPTVAREERAEVTHEVVRPKRFERMTFAFGGNALSS